VTVTATPERLALSPDEAATAISVSRDYFDKHVAPDLRIVRRGRRRLVPVRELERWLDLNATRTYDPNDNVHAARDAGTSGGSSQGVAP
jgi:hypothetical protein